MKNWRISSVFRTKTEALNMRKFMEKVSVPRYVWRVRQLSEQEVSDLRKKEPLLFVSIFISETGAEAFKQEFVRWAVEFKEKEIQGNTLKECEECKTMMNFVGTSGYKKDGELILLLQCPVCKTVGFD